MASSTVYHARSVSLPSRPHPTAEQVEEQLCRLRSSQSASSSTTFVSDSLNGLKDLYSCVDELLQQSVSQNQNAKWVDEVLDGFLQVLDICSASRDALQQSKERLGDVQSALRRRCSGELNVTKEAVEYLNTRKSVKKTIKKCLKNLKQETEQKDEAHATISLLKDVQAITADTLKSLMSYIVGSQKSGWSVVSKLINKNANKETSASEFGDVDATLNSLISLKKIGITSSQMESLMNQTFKLESQIQDLDESLECLFRDLVRTRATLLNIFSY